MTSSSVALNNEQFDQLRSLTDAVENALQGKPHVVQLALITLLAQGHILIEDVPGGWQDNAGARSRASHRNGRKTRSVHERLTAERYCRCLSL